jgi:hypothetical protein
MGLVLRVAMTEMSRERINECKTKEMKERSGSRHEAEELCLKKSHDGN